MSVVCPIFVIQICRQAAMFWLNISWVASVLLPFLLYMLWAKVRGFSICSIRQLVGPGDFMSPRQIELFGLPLGRLTFRMPSARACFAGASSGSLNHWPQYMDSWLARFCILVNACHRKSLGSHFTPVKTLDRHWLLHMHQCMKCNRWQVFSFKFHENSEKKNGKVPQIFKTLKYLLKIAKKICWC